MLDERRCEFLDLGVVIQKPRKGTTDVAMDRVRRCNILAQRIADRAVGCTLIVVEQLSLGVPGSIAKLSLGLSWGVVAGVCAAMSPRPKLLTIAPQRWQREVMPNTTKRVDYDALSRAAAKHILTRHPRAVEALERIAKKDRNHAIDAAMIALVGALRPHRCEVV